MLSRTLLFAVTAATLLTATPTLAAGSSPWGKQCDCCSDGSSHDVDHPLRHGRDKSHPDHASQPRTTDDNPDVRNQSFGG